jgi:sulfite reductase alpha subunit-like flavoprotein
MYTSEQDSTLSSFRPNTRLVLWEFLIVSFPAIFIFQWLPLQADNTNMQRVFFSWNLLIINSSHVPVMYVLYGTQTGTSRELAQDLTREAQRRGHTVVLQDVADFLPVSTSDVTYRTKTDLPEKKVVIFLCSTTGQGEVPDGMKVKQLLRVIYSPQSFWLFLLRRSLPVTSLQNTSYAVFGLGDSSYVKYNYVSKMLFNRLKQLGGTPLLRRGDGNDQHPFG